MGSMLAADSTARHAHVSLRRRCRQQIIQNIIQEPDDCSVHSVEIVKAYTKLAVRFMMCVPGMVADLCQYACIWVSQQPNEWVHS
jgi:hypothetical protein